MEGHRKYFKERKKELEARMSRKSSLRKKLDTESIRANEVLIVVVPFSFSYDATPMSNNKRSDKSQQILEIIDS